MGFVKEYKNKVVKVQRQLTSARLSVPNNITQEYYERNISNEGVITFTPITLLKSATGTRND